jgi:hypothetical protein
LYLVQFFSLLANCTHPCSGLYLYLRATVPVRVRKCTFVHVLARDYTCSYARLYLLVCMTVLVLARVFNCTRLLCVTVPAHVRDCTCSCVLLYFCTCTCSCARLYLLVCATIPAHVRDCTCTHSTVVLVMYSMFCARLDTCMCTSGMRCTSACDVARSS